MIRCLSPWKKWGNHTEPTGSLSHPGTATRLPTAISQSCWVSPAQWHSRESLRFGQLNMCTLHKTNISPPKEKQNHWLQSALIGDMWVPWRVLPWNNPWIDSSFSPLNSKPPHVRKEAFKSGWVGGQWKQAFAASWENMELLKSWRSKVVLFKGCFLTVGKKE